MEKILVIGPYSDAMKGALEDALGGKFELEYITSRDEYDRLADADYIVLRTLTLNADDIAKTTKAKLIQRWGAGYDTIDLEAAAKKGIVVAVCFGVNSRPVAEMTMALILAVYRNIVPLTNGINAGLWEREIYAKTSHTLHSKNVGLIGIGSIGSKVCAMCQGFGANVLYYDAVRLSPEREKELNATYCEFDELLAKSDIVSMHVPLLDSTRNMITRETFAKMKDGALFINTAREEVVDLEALKEALASGKLCGAGIDAIENPTIVNKPFADMRNVVLTPHLGGNTADDMALVAQRCAEQIIAVSEGKKLVAPNAVNLEFFD